MNNERTKPPKKSIFGRNVRRFCDTQGEFKSETRFVALRPIAFRIRHRIIEIADLLRLAVSPVPSA